MRPYPFRTYLKKPGEILKLSRAIPELTAHEMHLFPTGSPTENICLSIILTDTFNIPVSYAQISLEQVFKGMDPAAMVLIEAEIKRLKEASP